MFILFRVHTRSSCAPRMLCACVRVMRPKRSLCGKRSSGQRLERKIQERAFAGFRFPLVKVQHASSSGLLTRVFRVVFLFVRQPFDWVLQVWRALKTGCSTLGTSTGSRRRGRSLRGAGTTRSPSATARAETSRAFWTPVTRILSTHK